MIEQITNKNLSNNWFGIVTNSTIVNPNDVDSLNY